MSNSAISFNTAGLASTTSPGLVGTGAQTFAGKKTLDGGALIKGDTSGVAIASGYVGEVVTTGITEPGTIASGTGVVNIVSIVLPSSGIWIIGGHFYGVPSTTGTKHITITHAGSTSSTPLTGNNNSTCLATKRDYDAAISASTPMFRYISSGSQTIYLNLDRSTTISYSSVAASLTAIRIA